MTEMEAPNWVLKRARCNLEGVFDALYQRVQDDVVEINKLSSKRRRNHKFESYCQKLCMGLSCGGAILAFSIHEFDASNDLGELI